MQLLNNLFKVCCKWKNADIISFFLKRNAKKSEIDLPAFLG